MSSFTYNDKKLEAYLRNELPDEEIGPLEDELLRDDELFQQLQTVEMNLIDRYLENEMAEEDRHRFEATFLTNPANRWKLEEARIFRESLEVLRKRQSSTQKVAKFPFRFSQLAAAAVVLIFIALVVVWLVIRSQNPDPNDLTAQGGSPPPTPESSATPTPQPTPSPSTTPPTPDPVLRVKEQWLYLRDARTGVMGPGDDLPIRISPDTETIRLWFELLDDAQTHDVFRVSIKDEMGYNAVTPMDVRPTRVRYRRLQRRAISVDVPVSRLKIGQRYRFEIAEFPPPKTFVISR